MQNNFFAPPRAVVEDAPPVDDPRKPLAVWLVQILAAGLLCVAIVGMINLLAKVAAGRDLAAPRIGGRILLDLALLVLCSTTIVGSQRGRRHGRWGGMILIGCVFALFAFATIGTALSSRDTFPNASMYYGHITGVLIVAVVLLGPTALWFRAFALSLRARAWFGRNRQGKADRAADRWRA